MDDVDLIHISSLNQYTYCARRCALIYIEQSFEENLYTMRGTDLHERTDKPEESTWEGDIRVERALPLWHTGLGLIGKADVVEFHGDIPYPVEYKSGRMRKFTNDDLQLCAQAICLEKMTGKVVPKGAIFHHGSRRRREVSFSKALRDIVEKTVQEIRVLFASRVIPPPVNDHRCPNCSLLESCMPSAGGKKDPSPFAQKRLFQIKD